MISLLCIVIALYSGHIYRVIGEEKQDISKWSYNTISILSILTFSYLSVMSFIIFIIWDIRDDQILYQSVILLIITILLNFLFFKNSKSKLLLVISVLWCTGIVFYVVYVFNVEFFLVETLPFKVGIANIELALLCIMIALVSSYLIKLSIDNYDKDMIGKMLFVINLGVLVCSLTLSFALLVAKNNQIWLTLFSLVMTILFFILVHRVNSKRNMTIATIWNVIMNVCVLFLFFASYDV